MGPLGVVTGRLDGDHAGGGTGIEPDNDHHPQGCAYTLVILWALAGIAIKFAGVPVVANTTWEVFAVIALALIWFAWVRRVKPVNVE
jgi:hypothetical protein